jgi:hypothetical protein
VDPISTISGPVNASAFVDLTATASGASTLAEIGQLINKTNEVIGGLTDVAADVVAEEATRAAADSALDVRVDAAEANITLLQTGFSDHTALIQDVEGRVADLEFVTASGFVEKSSGDILTMPADTSHMINFTGTGGLQSLGLGTVMTDFTAGQWWLVVCNNADGVQISSSNWAHSSLTGGVANLNLQVGDMAIVAVVSAGGTKKWSAAKMVGGGGYRAAAALAGDLGAVDQDDRYIWVDRASDTGTRDLYLPELGSPTSYTNEMREITVVLYGTPTSGTFVVSCQGIDTFIDGATTFTMTEKSVCRFIGNDNHKWAVLVGGAN